MLKGKCEETPQKFTKVNKIAIFKLTYYQLTIGIKMEESIALDASPLFVYVELSENKCVD